MYLNARKLLQRGTVSLCASMMVNLPQNIPYPPTLLLLATANHHFLNMSDDIAIKLSALAVLLLIELSWWGVGLTPLTLIIVVMVVVVKVR